MAAEEITVSRLAEEGSDAEQEYTLKEVFGKSIKNDTGFLVYQSANFFGYSVTVGRKGEIVEQTGELIKLKLTVKATICSEEDTYDPNHGVTIVLGRLLIEDDGITIEASNKDSVFKLAEDYILNRVEDLADYIFERDASMSILEMQENQVKRDLKHIFREFK